MFYCNLLVCHLYQLWLFFYGWFLYYCPRHINCWVEASFPIAALVFLSACTCHFLLFTHLSRRYFRFVVIVVECLSSVWSLCLWLLLLALWECAEMAPVTCPWLLLRYDLDTQHAFIGDYSGQITLLKLEQNACSVITTLKGHEGRPGHKFLT